MGDNDAWLITGAGAPANKSFMEYVEYLSQKHYVPPDGKGWVDSIRKRANEANHEIKIMMVADAAELITFLEMLLKFIYEFPGKVTPATPTTAAPAPASGSAPITI